MRMIYFAQSALGVRRFRIRRAGIAFGLALQRDLDHRDDRVGEEQAHEAEQRAEEDLRAEDERGGEVDGFFGDPREDQIAVDRLDDEIDGDRSEERSGGKECVSTLRSWWMPL